MTPRHDAEEHLRVIRSLMERATIYRAISAPCAAVGGALGVAAGAYLALSPQQTTAALPVWLSLAVLVAFLNTVLLWRAARRRGVAFVSSGMKVALRAMAPGFLLAAAITFLFPEHAPVLPVVWTGGYAMALLATGHFAPHSLVWLGRGMFAATLAGLVLIKAGTLMGVASHWYMAATFGGLHLLYAACVWGEDAGEPT